MAYELDNHYWRAFNMHNFVEGAEYTVRSVSFGVDYNDTKTVTVSLYANNGAPFPAETGTLVGSSTLTVVGQQGTVVSTPLTAIVPAETNELVMELHVPSGDIFIAGANTHPETGPSYWSGFGEPDCPSTPQVISSHLVFNVYGNCTGPFPTPSPTPPPRSQLANISTRLHVGTGNDVGIGGFIITGAGTLQVVLRGIGPSLVSQGIPDFLTDPTLELHDSSGALLARNDNWQDDPNQVPTLTQLGLAPTDPNESALLQTLPIGGYTALLAGNNGDTGVGLVEVYNVDHSVPLTNNQLANISTRGFVQTGNNVMIGGFILSQGTNPNVLIRGLGPSLSNFGIPNPLADPTLELRDSTGTLVASNDNCAGSSLPPPDPLESCIEMSLAPAAYTAILAGNNGGTGIGLVEIYNLQ
jgi:hypothetical protein